MAVLNLDTTIEAIKSLQVPGLAEQRAFTDAVMEEAGVVAKAILDLDLQAATRHIARSILGAIR